jgi:predicted MPP superfamily phosphohydrolase
MAEQDDLPEAGEDVSDPPGSQQPAPGASLRHRLSMVAVGLHWLGTWLLRIALPLICANAMLRALPYRAKVAGLPFRVQGTLFTRRGFTADTTFGNWEFPHVDGLPIGVHVSPENVDLLRVSRAANPDTAAFVDSLKDGFSHEVPTLMLWLVGVTVLGIGLGLMIAAGLNMSIRYLRALPKREHELRLRVRQLAGAVVALIVVAGYGIWSFNSDWNKQSRLTGTLGAVQLFPSQLEDFYNKQSKVYDVLGAVVGIQAALQKRIDQQNTPDTAFNIMYISDMHLAAVYPLVQQYVDNFGVGLIVNTGDESEFGSAVELTPSYLGALEKITKTVPMLWVAGNHDSPEVENVMRHVPGVTVLGAKTRRADGQYTVAGSRVNAFGLTIGGIPDPRVYGAPGLAGSDKDAETDQLQRDAMDAAIAKLGADARFDIMATHEPAAAKELAKKLPGQIRQTNSGHTHQQNKTDDIQSGKTLNLVEGSTGAGGLDNINRGVPPPPIEFSIEAVAPDCQFTKLLRFQVADPASAPSATTVSSVRDDVTVATVYLAAQAVSVGRTCSSSYGVSQFKALDAPFGPTDAPGPP